MGIFKQLFFPDPIRTAPAMPAVSTVMTAAKIANIRSGNIVRIPVRKLILKKGEQCFFCDYAVRITEKLRIVARRGNGCGASFRICRGLTWHTGVHDTLQVRDNVQEYTSGKLYITDRRIVFSADSRAFQRPLASIVSYRTEGNDLILQFSGTSYRIYLPVADCAEKILEYVL